MQLYNNPPVINWPELCRRPALPVQDLTLLTQEIFNAIQQYGDEALIKYTQQFDQVYYPSIQIPETEIAAAAREISPRLKAAIQLAYTNIRTFHAAQAIQPAVIETTEGVRCWSESRAIEKVGLYIPGGTAPLFSTLLMLGIPAILAGCREIVLCTPPDREGNIHPAIRYTAGLIGITKIIKAGGIQAIAAMALGTASVPAVYKIFGPGNQYVTAAKQAALAYGVAIDLPAGPSEVLVIADEYADADFVAADLLAQAEHGTDSQVMLVCNSTRLAERVAKAIKEQLEVLPRKDIASAALDSSRVLIFPDLEICFAFSNAYAPEHLILNIKNAAQYTDRVIHAGSVFVGPYSCESAGDYASGTNHTLPTNGYARNYSGVSLSSFCRSITFQQLSREGIQNLGPVIEVLAEAEQLQAHKEAVSIRLKKLAEDNS